MRLLFAYWDLTVGGVQHMTVRLANGLAARGHEVTIALAFRAPGREPYALDPAVRVVDLAARRVSGYAVALAGFLRRERRYDAMLAATTGPNLAAVAGRALAGAWGAGGARRTPLAISERDNPAAGFAALSSGRARLLWRLKPLLYPRADAIVCVSTPLADALSAYAGIRRERIEVIHNPAAPDMDGSDVPPPHPWLADRTTPVVASAGRFHPQKDFPTLVRAFARLRERRPARLVLIGDGPERPRIEGEIADAGLEGDVLLPGFQADVMPWLARADLFAMSSVFEGFGNVLVQALAAGCRIVSTDCPDGPAEILGDGRFGALVPVGDPGAMAAAMAMALDEPHDPAPGRARAHDFAPETILDRYEALFRRLAA